MNSKRLRPCEVKLVKDVNSSVNDVVVLVDNQPLSNLIQHFENCRKFDQCFDSEISFFKLDNFPLPVVYSPPGELSDYHDVRIYQNAVMKGIKRAVKAGLKNPLLVVPHNDKFKYLELCSILSALHELYVPIQLREDKPDKREQVKSLSILMLNTDESRAHRIVETAILLESGSFVARDIGVGDPERMAPSNVEAYVKSIFNNIKMEVISDPVVFKNEYPLFEAVNRAASSVPRHQGRIIFLEYRPPQPAKKTIMLVGKGVTYDTGGADIKAGGVMAGMSRDKCGAAAVAGFMQIVQARKPTDIHVIAALCMVRNSVGEECYVADEVITSRAGVRVRVGNTDAEGRMCMTDALCKMKELAVNLPDPHIYTIATLTGHACLAVGEGYSIVLDNSVARCVQHAQNLQKAGEDIGQPFEISTLRHDDFDFNSPKVIGEDIVQCNNLASSRTPRGHQMPAAFMVTASGLDKHGVTSGKPLKYSHLDIAASSGEYPKMPTAAPILALAKLHFDF